MVHPSQVEGKLYVFLPKAELKEMDITLDTNVTDIVRIHKVICLGTVHGRPDYVKVMTITTKVIENHDYVPISPTRKKPYDIQIKLRNNLGWGYSRGQPAIFITTLPELSYLKIDEFYEVPVEALREATDDYENPLSIPTRHHGGLAELKNHIRCRDKACNSAAAYQQMHERELLEFQGSTDLSIIASYLSTIARSGFIS
ncbi:hypothetical protein sscle_10g079900 [Sclerotinia sclerotiorum 1980 UF-70]|uniref:Uncharacterized protein n=1 Tax=Sclerotinia sclerotiorum (strain ATCC 18683 / 1980 / Ss-1) TaxID=665079 RepID=A0A1D9QE36_SCLS1|nr:hypothetical protein sscle_10g079900 [Sclerotinia sclerotiorum 1980 UF-70]